MTDFINDLIKYIDAQFFADTHFTEKPRGYYAYQLGIMPENKPYYVVEVLGDTDSREDFSAVVSHSVDLQITIYGTKTSSNSAMQNAMSLADRFEDFLTNYKNKANSVVSMRKNMRTTPYTFFDGSKSYTVTLRYSVELATPYVSVN